MDVALFHYGYLLQSYRYMKEARSVYDKLLKNYPMSLYIPTAHLAFGDYYYDQLQLADAEARYKMVLKFPKAAVYGYAQFKLGLVQMQLQRYQEALEMMFQAITTSRTDERQSRVTAAARTGFVIAYREIGKFDKALPAFKRVDAQHAQEMLDELVKLRAAPEWQAQHAETIWNAAEAGGNWSEAAQAYAEIASDTSTPNERARRAALIAIAAFKNALSIESDPVVLAGKLELKRSTARATPLTEAETQLVDLFTLFETLVRDSQNPELGEMLFLHAALLRQHNDHAAAVPVLVDYVHWHRTAANAELAARMLLDSLAAQGKLADAREVADRWDADFLADKAGLQRDIEFVRSRSKRR